MVSGICYYFYFFIVMFGEEHHVKKRGSFKKPFKEVCDQTKLSIRFSCNHPVLFYLFLIVLIGGVAGTFASFISLTPFLVSLNFPDYGFGYLASLFGLAGIFSPLISNLFIKKDNERKILIISGFITFLMGFFILFVNNLILALIILFISISVWEFKFPIRESYFHKFIPSKMRATIGSIKAMILSLAGILALPLTGLLVDTIGARLTIFISGLLMIPLIIFYFLIKEKS